VKYYKESPDRLARKISKHHQRNIPAWSHDIGQWWVCQGRRIICRSEEVPITFILG